MKRVRITYPGAFHHAMNRGYDGNDIFSGNKNKAQFLDFLEGTAKKLKIHLFAYGHRFPRLIPVRLRANIKEVNCWYCLTF
jgi:hypothetical protein